MAQETFNINTAWNIEPPCFVRKVDAKFHWQDAATIQEEVFRPLDNGTISIYSVQTEKDLIRVAIALNANRSNITEPIFLAAITPHELSNFTIRHSSGQTLCNWANSLHRDIVAKNYTAIASLAHNLMAANRQLKKFTKPNMRKALAFTSNQGCHAADPQSNGCVCEDELPKPNIIGRVFSLILGKVISLFRQ